MEITLRRERKLIRDLRKGQIGRLHQPDRFSDFLLRDIVRQGYSCLSFELVTQVGAADMKLLRKLLHRDLLIQITVDAPGSTPNQIRAIGMKLQICHTGCEIRHHTAKKAGKIVVISDPVTPLNVEIRNGHCPVITDSAANCSPGDDRGGRNKYVFERF